MPVKWAQKLLKRGIHKGEADRIGREEKEARYTKEKAVRSADDFSCSTSATGSPFPRGATEPCAASQQTNTHRQMEAGLPTKTPGTALQEQEVLRKWREIMKPVE